ncbi:MAG: PKD domain-containing protein, partial [Methanospirillum sp.]|nr:PKD domain-containing protein [Methanospirillum sp.]
TEAGFMNWTIPLDGSPSFLTYVNMSPTMDLIVRVEGMYNSETGLINLSYESLDPITLLPPEDTTIGFLPPITSDGTEITWFAYSAETNPGLATGTEIKNRAWVQFDGIGAYNPAPPNQSYVNTIDASKPVSDLTATANGTVVNVQVSGSDAGSGISSYMVFASMDNGDYYPAASGVTGTTASFTGSKGHTYRLYSQATDNVGNVEDTHSSPDATVTITAQETPILSRISPNSAITGSGPVIITASGSGFTASSLVRVDGSSLSTGYVSGTGLRGEIPAAYLTTSGTRSIDVLNTDSELVSNSLPFTVTSGRTWYITATSSGNGTISPSGLVAVPEGGDQAFTITPSTGFSIEDVLVDGDSVGAVPGYTFSNVVSNRTLNARFAEIIVNKHTINATSDDWTINYPHGNRTYPEGSNKTYITQAKPGAELSDVKVDTTSQGSITSYPFTNITKDHTIITEGNPAADQVHVFFNITPRSGKIPLTVECTDQSLGNPRSWRWQFGDGTNSTEKNTTHTYRIPGVYSVSLEAFNNQTSGTGICNGCVTVT